LEGIAEGGLVFIIFISSYIITFTIEILCKDTKNILNKRQKSLKISFYGTVGNNQILGRFFEYYVKHYFIIEPRTNSGVPVLGSGSQWV
jgi:hypothetical protein